MKWTTSLFLFVNEDGNLSRLSSLCAAVQSIRDTSVLFWVWLTESPSREGHFESSKFMSGQVTHISEGTPAEGSFLAPHRPPCHSVSENHSVLTTKALEAISRRGICGKRVRPHLRAKRKQQFVP